jgi:tight adherence protein B
MAKKTAREPQFFKNSLGFPTYNYNVYYLNLREKFIYSLIAFVIGGAIGFIFYGGYFKDPITQAETSMTTLSNAFFFCLAGIVAVILFLPIRAKQLLEKNKKDIRNGFRGLLDSLVASISSGLNSVNAFDQAQEDLIQQFGAGSKIVQEVSMIVNGFNNGKQIEEMLEDFAKRTGDDDIKSFTETYKIANSKGGSLAAAITSSQIIINEKVEIEGEIETAISGNKNETYIMVILPIVMIVMIKYGNPSLASGYSSLAGFVAVTISIVLYITAFFIARAITRIKV